MTPEAMCRKNIPTRGRDFPSLDTALRSLDLRDHAGQALVPTVEHCRGVLFGDVSIAGFGIPWLDLMPDQLALFQIGMLRFLGAHGLYRLW